MTRSMPFNIDHIIFSPNDVDLSKSPLKDIKEETFILGAFNPGLNILPNGNLIMMVRIAEALKKPIKNDCVRQIRWTKQGVLLDEFKTEDVDFSDSRKLILKEYKYSRVHALTSFSWLLPVELSKEGSKVITIHYDKIITASESYQEYGIEDARLSLIDNKYYMTTCCVSSERQATVLYTSLDGLNYTSQGLVLDHGNKDMVLFEGKINNKFYALTRPMGNLYFPYSKSSKYLPIPSINMASSHDALHWKPTDYPFIRGIKNSLINERVGGGTQPILTSKGWLILYHGVEGTDNIGIYRMFWAILKPDNPHEIIDGSLEPLMEANSELTKDFENQIYIENVVFSTGIVQNTTHFIVASGELDLCCRITHIPKKQFNL